MRTEHYFFFVLRITHKSRANVCAQWMMSLSPRQLATDPSKAVILVQFLLYATWSRRFMSYFVFLFVSCSGSSCQLGKRERADFSAIVYL